MPLFKLEIKKFLFFRTITRRNNVHLEEMVLHSTELVVEEDLETTVLAQIILIETNSELMTISNNI